MQEKAMMIGKRATAVLDVGNNDFGLFRDRLVT
jgi:hypothetical protein